MATVEHRLRPVEDVADPPAEKARAQLECLYRDHAQRVYAICASVLRDRHEAEDAAQQVFVSAFRALLRGSEPRDPCAWLATIARNESRSRARRQPNLPLQPELRDVTQEDPSTVVVRRGELARVWQAIETLPASQRDALLLREVRGLGYDELAAELQLSRPSLRSLLNRARRTLRGQLEKGAAALTGAPWLNLFARVFGDVSSPTLSSASRTAAVGFGALAITGGAVDAPSLTGPARHRPAARVVAHPTVAATRPVGETQRQVAAVPVALATSPGQRGEPRAQPREGQRPGGRRSSGSDDHRGGEAASGGGKAGDDGPSGGGNSGSESRGGSSASSGGGGPGSGTSSGTGSRGHDGSASDGPSDDSQTQVMSSSGGGSSGSSGGSVLDGGSSGGGSTSTSDGGGGSGSSGSSGSDDGSGGSPSLGSGS